MRVLTISAFFMLAACANADEVGDQLDRACKFARYPSVSGVELPVLEGAPSKPPDAGLLSLGAEETLFQMRLIGKGTSLDREMLEAALSDEIAIRERLFAYRQEKPIHSLLLAVDVKRPLPQVREALEIACDAGIAEVYLLARSSEPLPTPEVPDRELYERLRAYPPAERAIHTAMAIEEAITLCPGLTEMFAAIASAPPEMKCEMMASGTREALGGFCLVDEDAYISAILATSVPLTATGFVVIKLEKNATPLDGVAATTWGEAFALLASRAP